MKSLTAVEKTHILGFLKKQIDMNAVESEFIPYLKTINSIKGICTTQCCTGHNKEDGFLRLRLSGRLARALEHSIDKLYSCYYVHYLDKRYHRSDRWMYKDLPNEIYEEFMIGFTGLNKGKQEFVEAIEYIITILKSLSDEV